MVCRGLFCYFTHMQLESRSISEQKAFVSRWPLARVKKMKLAEYTSIADKGTFCYALEFLTDENGSIRGGSAYKFGIFKRQQSGKAIKARHLVTDGTYGWYRKYGTRRDAAFRQIRKQIVSIIEAAQAKEFEKIDAVDLGLAVKWKIAFLYAPEYLIPIYARHVLANIAFVSGLEKAFKLPVSALQAFLISQKPENQLSSDYALDLWQAYVSIRPGEDDSGDRYLQEQPSTENWSQVAEPQAAYGKPRAKFDEREILQSCLQSEKEIREILTIWQRKKNMVLQGPPGVGKSFLARRLAWLLMGSKNAQQVEWVQFHPNYAYEDFVMGLRPDGHGHFQLQAGKFLAFCARAAEDLDKPYVFVIDEINRAHLTKVLGELMYLLEADKRNEEHAVRLSYDMREQSFFVPPNLYLIGTMNTADRSLATMDYALRRRFAFIPLLPAFNEKFIQLLQEQGISADFAQKIAQKFSALNTRIIKDRNLGEGFAIGHSYFISDLRIDDVETWYEAILDYEIKPLLKEYWFDENHKVDEQMSKLAN